MLIILINRSITYCEGPWDDMATKCMNDGRQFHLTQLRLTDPKNGKQSESSGRFAPIYDSTYHNAYRLYNETEDIRQFHVYLKLTGDEKADNYDVAAEVLEYKARKGSGEYQSLATKDHGEMKDGEEFTITGLPRPLKVEKSGSGCGTYTFTYGDKTDGNRVFRFRSDDKGADAISQFSVTANEKGLEGHYCVPEIMTDTIKKGKDKGKVVTIGTKLKCSFPGW